MARSKYIYLVYAYENKKDLEDEVGTIEWFGTVKHEALSFMHDNKDSPWLFRLYRVADGDSEFEKTNIRVDFPH